MKPLFIFLLFYAAQSLGQQKVYDISLPSVDGARINMSVFKSKKILVTALSADNLLKHKKAWLDSLQQRFPNLVIIAVPATDMEGGANEEALSSVKSLENRFIVAGASSVRKSSGEDQHALMRWLTDVKANRHFDIDAATDGHLYVISESGVLYAVLDNSVSNKALDEILRQDDVKVDYMIEENALSAETKDNE